MKLRKLSIIFLLTALTLFMACDCEKEESVVDEIVQSEEIPTVTNDAIESFLKDYPIVQRIITEKSEELQGVTADSPVAEARANEIMENVKKELRNKGIDPDHFFGIYQKIIVAAMYIGKKEQAKNLNPEKLQSDISKLEAAFENPGYTDEQKAEITAKIAELEAVKEQISQSQAQLEAFKTKLEDPGITEEEKSAVENQIYALESALGQRIDFPEGLTEEEVAIVTNRFSDIIAITQPQVPVQPTQQTVAP